MIRPAKWSPYSVISYNSIRNNASEVAFRVSQWRQLIILQRHKPQLLIVPGIPITSSRTERAVLIRNWIDRFIR